MLQVARCRQPERRKRHTDLPLTLGLSGKTVKRQGSVEPGPSRVIADIRPTFPSAVTTSGTVTSPDATAVKRQTLQPQTTRSTPINSDHLAEQAIRGTRRRTPVAVDSAGLCRRLGGLTDMPSYNLNALGSAEFERLCQSLLKAVIGAGTITFGAGPDGGREATYEGSAPYPSEANQWTGQWIFQAKFHDLELLGVDKARRQIVSDLDSELDKITNKYKRKCDNYILITNVPLTSTHQTGTHDRLSREVISRYRTRIPHIAVWGADDVSRLLELHASVRTAYLGMLVSGDVIADLMNASDRKLDETTITIQSYIQTTFDRDRNAQLDQAGDVADEPIALQNIFLELDATIAPTHEAEAHHYTRQFQQFAATHSSDQKRSRVPTVKLLLSDRFPRVVLIGGPGEGKSTVGQYLAQLHRAALLNQLQDVVLDEAYAPMIPRLPLRVILKDFGQWLADIGGENHQSARSLDAYLVHRIRTATDRAFTVEELHRVLRRNPSLLILDGLDEVTDQDLRGILLERISEFTNKAKSVLDSDMQILATTRPTGYTAQFNPRNFLHLQLVRLQPPKVRYYVGRWIEAKRLDDEKASRIRDSIEECLADPQISLLTNTPLQVTILLLIVLAGGTPPRQREALFDEYLEVIYKREKAKARSIIRTEKELLFGLHKYTGYILHEEAATAQLVSSALSYDDYHKHVNVYLTHNDPYSSAQHRQTALDAIVKDAGERLVLLVESPASFYGFELRSIQEFFAACHLTDTACDTEQRYRRFEAICRHPHWRNVSLFFAGRVGRSYSGEAANILEVCKAVDRDGADFFVRRGSTLALELANDRAFGPNRRLQRSLLEYGLSVLDGELTLSRRANVVETVARLPSEDIRDHVVPVLRQKVQLVAPARLENTLATLQRVVPGDEAILRGLSLLASNAGDEERRLCVELLLEYDLPTRWVAKELRGILKSDIGEEALTQAIECTLPGNLYRTVRVLEDANLPAETFDTIFTHFLDQERLRQLHAVAAHQSRPARAFRRGWERSLPRALAESVTFLSYVMSVMEELGFDRPVHLDLFAREEAWEDLVPQSIRNGGVQDLMASWPGHSEALAAPLWALHLMLGRVSEETISTFESFYLRVATRHPWVSRLFKHFNLNLTPFMGLLVTALDSGNEARVERMRNLAVRFCGRSGLTAWADLCSSLDDILFEVVGDDAYWPSIFGPAVLPSQGRKAVETMVVDLIGEPLPDHAVRNGWRLGRRRRLRRHDLSVEEVLRLVEYIQNGDDYEEGVWLAHVLALRPVPREPEVIEAMQVALRYSLEHVRSTGALQAATSLLFNLYALGDDSFVEPVAEAVAENMEDENLHVWDRLLPIQKQKYMLRELISLGSESERNVSIGACIIARRISESIQSPQRIERRRALSFRDLPTLRRRLLGKSGEARLTGIALYSVRPPHRDYEFRAMGTEIRACDSSREAVAWRNALRSVAEGSSSSSAQALSDLLTEVLGDSIWRGLRGPLTDILEDLQGKLEASIHQWEPELGLPLARMEPDARQ
jgi:hypothetical protein